VHGVADGTRSRALGVAMLASPALLAAGLLAGCSLVGSDPAAPDTSARAAPLPPPAACLLDTAVLATDTGLTWTPDQTTATDTRCVYDPAGAAATASDGPAFVAVDVAVAAGDPGAQLDTLAQLCEAGSRAPVDATERGFVCRFQGGSVFAALVHRGRMVTVAASAVPAGTTAAGLVVAFGRQLGSLGR
jgi:hypothetical protein